MEFANLVSTVGFPIACCGALAIYINNRDKKTDEVNKSNLEAFRQDSKEDKEMLLKELQYSREVNAKVMSSNEMLVREVIPKLDKVLEKVGE